MQITFKSAYKSIPRELQFDLPNFCVLTGKNGSGKSHLLEAISNLGVAKVTVDEIELKRIHYVPFNGLNPEVDEQCDQNAVVNNITNTWRELQPIVVDYKNLLNRGTKIHDVVKDYMPRHQNPRLSAIVSTLLAKSAKTLDSLTHDDLFKHINFVDTTQNHLFFSQCALIFKGYHSRQIKNDIAELRLNKGLTSAVPYLNEEQFIKHYGPPPWELINDVLKKAELPYEVADPQEEDFDLPYRLRLVDRNRRVEISVNNLSSGEKVLMSLALAIYNTQEGASKPELLLLDEPDAPLHPQFSKLLIDTIVDTIVKKSGVNVIITTHSPSTVAMAPAGSVYEMEKDRKSPQMVSNSHAIEILTSGLNFLKISYENRRQIFVESKYDVLYFQKLWFSLNRKYKFIYAPVFLEPHSGTSNSTDVITIVEKLRLAGSDLVFGIVDYDQTNKPTDSILVVGQSRRYAIENYILDPLFVSLALIRHGRKTFASFGVDRFSTYVDSSNLTVDDCQTIVTNFLAQIGINHTHPIETKLENGFTLHYPQDFLSMQGHEYENKIIEFFPELNAIARGQGDSALKLGILQVIEEFPQYLSEDLSKTFLTILGSEDGSNPAKSLGSSTNF